MYTSHPGFWTNFSEIVIISCTMCVSQRWEGNRIIYLLNLFHPNHLILFCITYIFRSNKKIKAYSLLTEEKGVVSESILAHYNFVNERKEGKSKICKERFYGVQNG